MTESRTYPVDALLLLGPTGAGKTPLGELLTSRGFLGRRCIHLDFGAELRSIASGIDAASFTSDEKDYILGVLDRGLLLENEHFPLAKKIITLFLDKSRFRPRDVLVLNGIPRHVGQAADIASLATIHAVIVLDCSVESVFKRIEENSAGDRTGRIDDERMLVENKLRTFAARTAPLIDHYRSAGRAIYHVPVNERTTTGSAYHQLSTLAAADPPVAFIAEPPER
jgi:adenylate kinase